MVYVLLYVLSWFVSVSFIKYKMVGGLNIDECVYMVYNDSNWLILIVK